MSHLVIINTTQEKSYVPCEDLDVAVATIERFRNEENVESCELFELNPISFEFKPYYHVALATGSASVSTPSAPSVPPMAATAVPESPVSESPVSESPVSESAVPESPVSENPVAEFSAPEVAAPEVNVPVLAAVESPNPFDTATGSAPAAVAETPFSTSFDVADEAPSDLDTTLANAGVPSTPPIPPLPEAVPPAPAFGEAPAAADPFTQTPSEAAAVATGAPSGFGFELDPSSQSGGFDLAEETPEVADLFGSGAELPPPPPPPVAEVEEAPKRGLFGR